MTSGPQGGNVIRRGRATVVVSLLALALAGCSSDRAATVTAPRGERSTGSPVASPAETTTAPSALAPSATAPTTSAPTVGVPSTSVAEPVRDAPTTSLLPASAGLPDELATNSRRRPIELDETALLACANNQIAFVRLQQADAASAARELVAASQRAAASSVPAVRDAAGALMVAATASDPGPTVLTFLGICTERGFEY